MRTLLLLLALAPGCTRTLGSADRVEPTFLTVALSGDLGTQDAPLDFNTTATDWTVEVHTLDHNGDAYPYNGDLKIRVRPGTLDMDPWVPVTDGVYTGTVTFHAGFGPTRIWFSDEGDKSSSSTRAPSYATGVSDPIWYKKPTIREMQTTTDNDTNALEGEFAELRVDDRQVVVTALGTDGFWVTDLADEPGTYNSLFVYTFNEPRDVVLGDRLTLLNGGDNEYLGATQFSWPTYESAEGESYTPPDPFQLDETTGCDDAALEGLEAALVELPTATIPSDFVEGSETYADWLEYGQWPVSLGACSFVVESDGTVPDFLPTDHVGETLTPVRGLLTQLWSTWVILPRGPEDLGLEAEATAKTVSRPRPRPVPATLPPSLHAP